MEAGIKFVVGQEYYYRHIGDSELFSRMTIVSRTEKTAMVLREYDKEARRYKIHNWDGVEVIRAGNYSMAGSWRANNIVADEEETSEPVVDTPEPEAPSNCIPFPSKAPTAAPEPLPSLSRAEALPMVALGRKILTEALRTMGQQAEIDLIEAILDRDHWKMLETLRGAIAAGKVG
jgi:hypothetical protein